MGLNEERRPVMNICEFWTPPKLAKHWRVSVNKILYWIDAGELVAINMAANTDGKHPRWRISQEAVETFERRRSAVEPAKKRKRRPFERRAIPHYFRRHLQPVPRIAPADDGETILAKGVWT